MHRTLIRSNILTSIGYDSEYLILEVEYKSKDIYHFLNVPLKTYQELMNPLTGSPDDFFDKVIEGNYSFYKVEG